MSLRLSDWFSKTCFISRKIFNLEVIRVKLIHHKMHLLSGFIKLPASQPQTSEKS